MDSRNYPRRRPWHDLFLNLVALTALAGLLAACFPPQGPVELPGASGTLSTIEAPETPETSPTEIDWSATNTAGVALAMQAPAGSQVLLQPAQEVRAALTFQGFRDELTAGNVPGILPTSSGCVLMALLDSNGDEEPELVYTDLLDGQIIAPTSWSDFGVYTTTVSTETVYVAGSPIAIASATMLATPEACDDTLDASLGRLFQATGGAVQTAQRLLLAVPNAGVFQTYLVIIEPGEPSGCTWVLSQCSGCKNCGYEVVCNIAEYLCK